MSPDLAPGVDFVTKTGVGPFIDTGYSFNRLDPAFADVNRCRVYLSVDTLREMAQEAGLLDAKDGDMLDSYDRGYAAGHNDAVKENLNASVLAAADSLGVVADWVRSLAPAEQPSDAPS